MTAAIDKMDKMGQGLGWRHVQVFLMFLNITTAILMRVFISVAIVAMTQDKVDGESVFDCTPLQQGVVLGSFLWGYMTTQVAGGAVASRSHATRWLAGSLSVTGLLCIISPILAVKLGWVAVVVIRVLSGIIQGCVFPSTMVLMGRWIPPEERGRSGGIIMTAQPLGNMLAMVFAGVIIEAWGWPALFYVYGGAGIVMAALTLVLSSDHPDLHPHISVAERDYINNSVRALSAAASGAGSGSGSGSSESEPSRKMPVPWGAIARSVPLWTLLAAHLAYVWCYWVAISGIPTYSKQVLQVGIVMNGIISSLPYLAMLILGLAFGWASGFIDSKKWISRTANRLLFNTIGSWVPAVLLTVLALLPEGYNLVGFALLTLAVGCLSGTFTGCLINYVDLSPNFGGITFGIGNAIGSFVSAFAPYAQGLLVDPDDPLPGWNNVFFLTSGIIFVLNLIWLLGGTAEEQPWSQPEEKSVSRLESNGTHTEYAYDNQALEKS